MFFKKLVNQKHFFLGIFSRLKHHYPGRIHACSRRMGKSGTLFPNHILSWVDKQETWFPRHVSRNLTNYRKLFPRNNHKRLPDHKTLFLDTCSNSPISWQVSGSQSFKTPPRQPLTRTLWERRKSNEQTQSLCADIKFWRNHKQI